MFTLRLTANSPIPKHRQIYEQFRTAILSGELKPGDKLPTQAEFLERWGSHIVTVSRAMRELMQEGLVIAKPAKGRFVADRIPTLSPSQKRERLVSETHRYLDGVLPLGCSLKEIRTTLGQIYRKGQRR